MSVESCTHALTRTSHGVASRGFWAVGMLPSAAPQAKTHCGECRGRNVVCCRPWMIHSHVTDASRLLGTYYYLPCYYSLSSISSSHPIIARVAT